MEKRTDHKSSRRELMTRYVLGTMSEEERSEVEDQSFADPEFFHELESVRDELIDDYLRVELPAEERELFEKNYLSLPHGCERVEFARALLERLDRRSQTDATAFTEGAEGATARAGKLPWRQSWFRDLTAWRAPVAAAAIVLLLVLSAWLYLRNQPGPKPPVGGEQAQVVQPPQAPTPADNREPRATEQTLPHQPNQPAPKSPDASPSQLAMLLLSPYLARDSEATKKLKLAPEITTVQLQLEVEAAGFLIYRAVVQTPEGEQVLVRDDLKAEARRGGLINLRLPAKLLKDSDYIVRLSGVKNDGVLTELHQYYFRINR
jgi:anti-sigma-K factor RskA